MKFLVVEDSETVVETLRLCVSIRWPGTEVLVTARGKEAPALVESASPDLVILDLMLPDADGMEVLREVRTFSDVPVLIVTAKGDEVSRVKGLEMGADDYIVKPFAHTEFLARVRAILRRANRQDLGGEGAVITAGGLTINLAASRVFVDGADVNLTPIEWSLLSLLVRNEGRVMPHGVIAERVWGTDEVENSAIKMAVRRLRVKLNDAGRIPALIRTYRGRGYSFARPRVPPRGLDNSAASAAARNGG